jgi:phosphoglycolate phosphatase
MNTHDVNGRPWDSFDAYLFDIDGTLLNCTDAVHYFAFCDTLRTVSGREMTLEGVTAHGNTDVGILRDALAVAGVNETEWRPRLLDIQKTMGRFVAQREAELCATALPSVHEVLAHLRARGAILGIATGNLEEIGKLKLKAAGLLDYFSIGGWSDRYEYRADVFGGAIELMRAATHPGAAMCVLGDTPADVLAAHVNDLPVIALCSGVYSHEQLMKTKPDLCLQSFEELFR